jgi:hypothetical protein
MSELVFDLLDELYFVQHFDYLKQVLQWEDDVILFTLQSLFENDLIKCFVAHDQELFQDVKISDNGKNYYYLASKKGLMLHNSI